MASEKEYDDIIAPALLSVAQRCRELGMTMVARVEWEPDVGGITQIVPNDASITQKLTQLAAHSRGNIDGLCIAALKRFDCSQSVILAPFTKEQQR